MTSNDINIDLKIRNSEIALAEESAQPQSSKSQTEFIPVTPENFNDFSYSKKSHFDIFSKNGYDKLFYGKDTGPDNSDIKKYQNLLIFSFITQNIPEGSRILEIGCGDDYILNHFKYRYECWRLEDVTVLAVDEESISSKGFIYLKDNNGNNHSNVPIGYFDFVFSATAFYEMSDEERIFETVLDKIDKFVKPGGYSLHCFPAVIVEKEHFYYHPFLSYINKSIAPIFKNVTRFIRFPIREKVLADPDLHYIYELFPWAKFTNESESLNTVSYNFLWMKKMLEIPEFTQTSIPDFLQKTPVYVFHHIMKCGGTSVKEILQNWFDTEYDYMEEAENKNQFLKYKLNLNNLISETCITGHFQYEGIFLEQRYPEILKNKNDFKIFTFVRDPLKICISLYYYNKNNLGIENMGLKDSMKYFTHNFLASLFNCNEDNYKNILDRYFFIGIVEKMQDSFDKLADILNKKRITLPVSNRSEKDSQLSEITTAFKAEFRERNKLDYLIYDYCLEKFIKI